MRPTQHRLAAVVGLSAVATVAIAQSPAFDCAKAQGQVEQQICASPALGRLDRQLADVYRAAGAKAQANAQLAARLRTEQRGWVKGRNDCWKATQQTWITATWTVDTVAGCIDAQYRLRIAELQAVWRLLPPRTVEYACQGNPANRVVASYFASNPAALRLERGDRTKTLWQVGAPPTGSYEGQNVSLTEADGVAAVVWMNEATGATERLACKPL